MQMKAYMQAVQHSLTTKEKTVLYQGMIETQQSGAGQRFTYNEKGTNAYVEVLAKETDLFIKRSSDVESTHCFRPFEETKGKIMSEFGLVEFELYTHKYIQSENIIFIEYDVMQNHEIIDRIRIVWEMKEDFS